MAVKQISKMEIRQVGELIPYINNSRTHSPEQIVKIRASLREFGFINPVIIDKDCNVIAGHGRLLAAAAEGIKEVPCVLVDYLTEAQRKAYIIADNKLALDAGWDDEILRVELESLKDLDFDLNLTGFDESDLNKLLSDKEDIVEDEFDEVEPENVFVEPGDIWHLGKHRLLCGDSTDSIDALNKLMEGNKANLLLTDPPYAVDISSRGKVKMKIENDNLNEKDFHTFLLKAFNNAFQLLEPGGSAYVFCSSKFINCFDEAFREAGFRESMICVWYKNSFVLGRSDYQPQHEFVVYGFMPGKHAWYSDRKQSSVWQFDRPIKSTIHPTMKPIKLMAYPIQNSTQPNGIVLDLFLGSGSTLIACEQLNRICYGVELSPVYSSAIVNRFIESQNGDISEVKCERGGKLLSFDEVKGAKI